MRGSKFNRLGSFADQAHRLEHRIHVIPNVEELGAKLQAHLLADGKHFEDGKVPVLESWTTNNIAACIPKVMEWYSALLLGK
ncbi:MAG: hypothetical protein WB711_09745 [Terriglobales bacterium]